MTVAVILSPGLLPILVGRAGGTGSEVMQRIARADGWRHDHRTAFVDVRDPRRLLPDAATAQGTVRGTPAHSITRR